MHAQRNGATVGEIEVVFRGTERHDASPGDAAVARVCTRATLDGISGRVTGAGDDAAYERLRIGVEEEHAGGYRVLGLSGGKVKERYGTGKGDEEGARVMCMHHCKYWVAECASNIGQGKDGGLLYGRQWYIMCSYGMTLGQGREEVKQKDKRRHGFLAAVAQTKAGELSDRQGYSKDSIVLFTFHVNLLYSRVLCFFFVLFRVCKLLLDAFPSQSSC